MAKPKFELTSDLIKIEPEPQEIAPKLSKSYESQVQHSVVGQGINNNIQQVYQHSMQQTLEQPLVHQVVNDQSVEPKVERQSISLYISKSLKKQFHLHCVQNGFSMTDAMELAIQMYLDKNS